MAKRSEVAEAARVGTRTFRAKVLSQLDDGSVLVSSLEGIREFACDILQTAGAFPLLLTPGDDVLVWLAGSNTRRGVLLGRIGPSADAKSTRTWAPDELLLEAKKGLTLRVGEGSITLCDDGRIVIRGKDLVSHAKRMNRIKGGSVSIN